MDENRVFVCVFLAERYAGGGWGGAGQSPHPDFLLMYAPFAAFETISDTLQVEVQPKKTARFIRKGKTTSIRLFIYFVILKKGRFFLNRDIGRLC